MCNSDLFDKPTPVLDLHIIDMNRPVKNELVCELVLFVKEASILIVIRCGDAPQYQHAPSMV